MRIGTTLEYRSGFLEAAEEVVELERAGLDLVLVPEAYSFDAVSQLGYLAARTHRIQLGSGVLQLYTRTPTLTAMSAASLDYLTGGRFILGLGASGPQVVEGFHGVRYDAPLGRTREILEVCQQVWRREPLVHTGRHYEMPLSLERGGSGLGKPLRMATHPVRDRIPTLLAAAGPRNVQLAAEMADLWMPPFLDVGRADRAFGAALAAGRAERPDSLGPLDVVASPYLAIGSDVAAAVTQVRARLALSIGGMGAPGRNFYFDLACAYGYESEAKAVQERFLTGDKSGAAAAVPAELVQNTCLLGSVEEIRAQVERFAAAGVTTLNVKPVARDRAGRIAMIETLRDLVTEHGTGAIA